MPLDFGTTVARGTVACVADSLIPQREQETQCVVGDVPCWNFMRAEQLCARTNTETSNGSRSAALVDRNSYPDHSARLAPRRA